MSSLGLSRVKKFKSFGAKEILGARGLKKAGSDCDFQFD